MRHPTLDQLAFKLLLVISGGAAGACAADTGSDDTQTGGATSAQFAADLVDNLNEQPIPGMVVKALDNETGEELGIESMSSADGLVLFDELPKGHVAFVVVGKPTESIDTYQYNIDSSAKDERLWIVSKSAAALAPGLANYQPDHSKATVAGGLYWINKQGLEEPVGCATVAFDDPTAAIRYFGDNNLPTRDTPSETDPTAQYRAHSNPLNGRYFVGNAPTGLQTVTALVNGKPAGSTKLVLFPGEISSDKSDSVCISNIYLEGFDENPTPKDCK